MTGSEFRVRRMVAGLTQLAAAARLGVTPATISRWENGHHPIPAATGELLERIAANRWV